MTNPKRPGRPALDALDPSVSVGFKCPSQHARAMEAQAAREHISLAAWMRGVLARALGMRNKEH